MPTNQDVGLAVKRLQWRHHREANRRLSKDCGLSLVQWDVLRYIVRHPDASLHAVAMATFQTDQSMGELAQRMTHRGLLERLNGPGRAVRHRVTEAGHAAYEAGSVIFDGVLAETIGTLSSAERQTLFELLGKSLAD